MTEILSIDIDVFQSFNCAVIIMAPVILGDIQWTVFVKQCYATIPVTG